MGVLGQARYLFLLMGFFSTYCGFIYNDFTSIPLKLFGDSCYYKRESDGLIIQKEDCVYPVGLDPAWFVAKNELNYVNSLKMKISVILGVMQMSLGVLMKALNSLYFRKYLDFFCEFLPQIVLLLALFGFMDLLIIMKWTTNYDAMIGATPPSVITMMIQMFLNFGYPEGPQTQIFV